LTPEEVEKLASEIPLNDKDRADDMQVDIEDTVVVEE
jgi:gluconate kinase